MVGLVLPGRLISARAIAPISMNPPFCCERDAAAIEHTIQTVALLSFANPASVIGRLSTNELRAGRSIGHVYIRQPGPTRHLVLTVLAYGTMVYVAMAAGAETAIDAEINDLRTLLPLDLVPDVGEGVAEAAVKSDKYRFHYRATKSSSKRSHASLRRGFMPFRSSRSSTMLESF